MQTITGILEHQASVLAAAAHSLASCASFSQERFASWLGRAEQIIFCGVGKSGHVAKKAAASFASLGMRAYFVHAAEMMHGDLGSIDERTLVVFASFSGRGAEILSAAKHCCARSDMCMALSAPNSALAGLCAMNLPLVCEESIANLPAPTASTTLTLALCDGLLAIAASELNFSAEDFGRHHPGGALGKRYYERAKDLAQPARCLKADASLRQAIAAMSGAGYALLVQNERLVGFLSDGDLRRALEREDFSLDAPALAHASKHPICISEDLLAFDARELAAKKRISTLVITSTGDETGQILGVLRTI